MQILYHDGDYVNVGNKEVVYINIDSKTFAGCFLLSYFSY